MSEKTKVQAVGEVKRSMPTRDDVVSAIIQNAHISNYGCDQVANAIMALFTDSAGGDEALRARVKELETALEACFDFMSGMSSIGFAGLAIVENARKVLEGDSAGGGQ